MKCFLQYVDVIETKPIPFRSMAEAKDEFLRTARELDRFGQKCSAYLHITPTIAFMSEYPDYALSLTEAGNLKVERT